MESGCGWLDRLRSPKIWNMSIFDWVTSLLGAWLVGRWLGLRSGLQWIAFLIAWISLGLLTHFVFGVNSELGHKLGWNPPPVRKAC
jgi:hypothetical protein